MFFIVLYNKQSSAKRQTVDDTDLAICSFLQKHTIFSQCKIVN